MTDSVDAIGIALQVTSALDTLGVADLKAEQVPDLVAALQRDFYLDEAALRRAAPWRPRRQPT